MKKQTQTVSCPKSMVGRVIGKNGETIRALQNYTGALIQIDQSTDPMKVTISGTQESVRLAISMVTDIVNGTFKGFAMLRQLTNEQAKGDATLCQPVYAPGYGLIPPSQQVYTPNTLLDAQNKLGMTAAAQNFVAAAQMPTGLPSYLDSQTKDPSMTTSNFLMGMNINNAFDKLSLGGANGFPQTSAMPTTAVSGCANLSPISSLDMLNSGALAQTLQESSVSPMQKSAALSAMGDLGLSLADTTMPGSLLASSSQLSLPTSFPTKLPHTGAISSPLSGSISPELPCGWTAGLNSAGSTLTAAGVGNGFQPDLPGKSVSVTDNNLASNFQQLTQFLKGSSSGSSYSDASDVPENPASSRLSPRSNTNSSVLFLVDPNGRPFTVDVSTGETQWINDLTAGHGLPPAFAAATMN